MTVLTKRRKNYKSKSKTISKSRQHKKTGGGKQNKTIVCSQEFVNLPRMDCLNKNCFTKKYKDSEKKLVKLNKQHDAFVAKTCNIEISKNYQLNPKTPEQWDCNNSQRKGKLFENILKLEDEINFTPCEKKHCGKLDYMDKCIDLGEEQCRIKYKDVIENIRKTKNKIISPLEECVPKN